MGSLGPVQSNQVVLVDHFGHNSDARRHYDLISRRFRVITRHWRLFDFIIVLFGCYIDWTCLNSSLIRRNGIRFDDLQIFIQFLLVLFAFDPFDYLIPVHLRHVQSLLRQVNVDAVSFRFFNICSIAIVRMSSQAEKGVRRWHIHEIDEVDLFLFVFLRTSW